MGYVSLPEGIFKCFFKMPLIKIIKLMLFFLLMKPSQRNSSNSCFPSHGRHGFRDEVPADEVARLLEVWPDDKVTWLDFRRDREPNEGRKKALLRSTR